MRSKESTVFTIQILHPGSGFYLNTNHESEDIEVLKALLNEPAFAGPRYQIVDQDGTVHYGPVATERQAPMNIEDLAQSLAVPVLDSPDIGLLDESSSNAASISDVGYTLEAVHEGDGTSIVSLRLQEAHACEIMRELWADVNFWDAPGGGSVRIETAVETEAINRVLGNCWIVFEPDRHRWLFHVHLV
jgi:hypothetical protein